MIYFVEEPLRILILDVTRFSNELKRAAVFIECEKVSLILPTIMDYFNKQILHLLSSEISYEMFNELACEIRIISISLSSKQQIQFVVLEILKLLDAQYSADINRSWGINFSPITNGRKT